tara:strand:+ start:1688 stop:2779 length:1092 start_codon:yes stop_codon:yes gene_type:complete
MNFIKKRYFLNLLFTFFIARLISCLFIFKYLSAYDSRFFVFTDLIEYNEAPKGFILTPNFFYAFFIRLIGYNSENLLNLSSIFISFSFSFFLFIPWIFLGSRILNKKSSFIYSILIGIHPYLALYSLKIDSTSFSIVPVALFAINQFLPNIKLKIISLWISIISSFFRSQTIILAWIQALYFFPKLKFKISKINISIFFALVLLVLCSLSQYDYGSNIVTENFGCYSFLNIKNFFISLNINKQLSNLFSVILTPIVHVFLLFGAREAIGVYCLNLPKEIASNGFINITSTIIFFLLHFSLFIKMIVWIFKNNYKRFIGLLIPYTMLLPNLYGAAHMRYILFLIPYFMFWLFEIKQENQDLLAK